MSVVRKAMMPMKKKASVRKRVSEIFWSSNTNRDSDRPTAPLRPALPKAKFSWYMLQDQISHKGLA